MVDKNDEPESLSNSASTDRPKIVIRPKNPRRHKREHLADMGRELQELVPDLDVVVDCEIPDDAGRYGVTFWEILLVALPAVGGFALKAATDVFVAWAKKRFVDHPRSGPKHVNILGPDGKIVRTVTVKQRDGEPEIKDFRENDGAGPHGAG